MLRRVSCRGLPEHSFEITAELRSTAVANACCSRTRRHTGAEQKRACFVQPHGFEVLNGRRESDALEVGMERRGTHSGLPSEVRN